jgi:hypothetical protein
MIVREIRCVTLVIPNGRVVRLRLLRFLKHPLISRPRQRAVRTKARSLHALFALGPRSLCALRFFRAWLAPDRPRMRVPTVPTAFPHRLPSPRRNSDDIAPYIRGVTRARLNTAFQPYLRAKGRELKWRSRNSRDRASTMPVTTFRCAEAAVGSITISMAVAVFSFSP